MKPLRHKLTTTDADGGHQRSFVVRPNTPLGQLLTVARADTRRAETPAAALEALAALLELETFLERTTDDLALAARRDGATWEQIGSALGTSRQAAQQRWGNISRFAGWEAVEEACRCAGDDRCDHPQRLTAARARLSYYQERLAAEPSNQPLTAALSAAASQVTRLELELDRLES
jgi:hypothetical protein